MSGREIDVSLSFWQKFLYFICLFDLLYLYVWFHIVSFIPLWHSFWFLFNVAKDLLSIQGNGSSDQEIFRDLHRTFPNHVFFKDNQGNGQRLLYNVLKAYSLFDKEVGYCQGMAFVAAVLLLYMPTEEDAFWGLVHLFQQDGFAMRGLYLPELPMLNTCLYQFEQLLHTYVPKLSQHLKAEGVSPGMYASEWFITIFSRSFPFGLVLRVWDCMLYEGYKVVFRVALALMRLSEAELMRESLEGIMTYFRSIPPEVLNPDRLLPIAFSLPLSRKQLQKLADQYEDIRLLKKSKRSPKKDSTDPDVENGQSSLSKSNGSSSISHNPPRSHFAKR